MIKTLHLGNFKAFAGLQSIPFRPLTLVFGANSAGKSSVLHALALANQAMVKRDLDPSRTQIGGDSIDLGGFRQYVHRRNDHNRVSLGFEFSSDSVNTPVREFLGSEESLTVGVEIGLTQREILEPKAIVNVKTNEIEWADTPTGKYETGTTPKVLSYEIRTAAGRLLSMSRRPNDKMQLDILNQDHPTVRKYVEGVILSFTSTSNIQEKDWQTIEASLPDLIPRITARCEGLLPSGLISDAKKKDLSADIMLPVSKGSREADLRSALEYFVPRSINDLVQAIYVLVQSHLDQMVYLGPLRSYPSRFLHMSEDSDSNWHAGGGYAWDLVLKDEKIRDKTNEWLSDSDKLSTPYTLEVKKLLELSEFVDTIQSKLSGDELRKIQGYVRHMMQQMDDLAEKHGKKVYPSVDEESKFAKLVRFLGEKTEWEEGFPFESYERMKEWLIPYDVALTFDYGIDDFLDSHLSTLLPVITSDIQGKQYLTLTDQRTRTAVTHRDVGIGISQVLPVLVYSYANKGKTIAIEQPEIHLHPALQAELGDVFIEAALGERKNTFLLETHSEHLILRIMRRIRETASGNLPAGKLPISAKDVSILYVEPSPKGSFVREMQLNDNGELVKAWPGGFFEEGLTEVLS